jgi:dihydroorotate dehydrogenase (fumarate)
MVNLSTSIGGIPFSSCIYNASGPRTGSSAAMSKINASKSGGVLAKSATIASQTGNDMPRTWHEENGKASLNSEGLPNNGIDYYIDPKTIAETMGDSSKPYMVSISGKTLADNLLMLKKISDAMKANPSTKIAGVELNLACPNIVGKPTIGYDFEQMEDVMKEVTALPLFKGSNPFPLGIKMPPYFDRPHFEQAASILNKYKSSIAYVASINTIGNALAIDSVAEMPCIRAKGGFAGLSGPAVKYTALANVKQMRELLDDSIDVVGVGGVTSGRDVFEMLLCGAKGVQVGTCHWTEGPSCFDRMCNELSEIMKEKGYNSVEDFRGKLKEWSKEGAALSRNARTAKKSNDEGAVPKTKDQSVNNSILIAVLFAVIAILLADKFDIVDL